MGHSDIGAAKNAVELADERMRQSIANLNERGDYYAARTDNPDLDYDDWVREKNRASRKAGGLFGV